MLRLHFTFGVYRDSSIIFFGSGKVAYPSLKILRTHFDNLQVVTYFTAPNQRLNNEVELFCKEANIPFTTPIKEKNNSAVRKQEWKAYVQQLQQPTFGVVCSFGYLIPRIVIEAFSEGLIVAHPSLLPKYRGGAPIFHAIANGEKQSGVSYLQISKGKFDEGNILHQVLCPISETDKYDSIEKSLAQFAADNLLQVIDNLDALRPGMSQKDLQIGIPKELLVAPIVRDRRLSFMQPAEKVYNLSRALQTPRVLLKLAKMELLLTLKADYLKPESLPKRLETGQIHIDKSKRTYVQCQDKLVRVTHYQKPTQTAFKISHLLQQFKEQWDHPDFRFE